MYNNSVWSQTDGLDQPPLTVLFALNTFSEAKPGMFEG